MIIMKKYFFGLSAIVLAIAFSAFTKPVIKGNAKTFEFGFAPTQTNVQNLAKWAVAAPATCQSGTVKACGIVVDEVYYHQDGSDFVLNTAAYIAGTHESGDLQMVINAELGSNGTDYRVSSTSTTATSITNTSQP